MTPRTLIIRTAGTNCDQELAHAFNLAGSAVEIVHLNRLVEDPGRIDAADLIGFPGGFSYGDDVAAGKILANRLRHRLLRPLQQAVRRGVPMIGICNGFQVLVKLGLLPDPLLEGHPQTVTLADNNHGRFLARWVGLAVPSETVCIWTRGLDRLALPIAHGEGRFVAGSQQVLDTLHDRAQVALLYETAPPETAPDPDQTRPSNDTSNCGYIGNPNGSTQAIAGICDPSGIVLGLMPHPERYTHPTHHPRWSRISATRADFNPAGLRMFQNAVKFVATSGAAALTTGQLRN